MDDRRFEFRFTRPYRIGGLPFGITPATCEVRVGAGLLSARFGPWHVETALRNIADLTITGPYTLLKTIGPVHMSLADKGLTFATDPDEASV